MLKAVRQNEQRQFPAKRMRVLYGKASRFVFTVPDLEAQLRWRGWRWRRNHKTDIDILLPPWITFSAQHHGRPFEAQRLQHRQVSSLNKHAEIKQMKTIRSTDRRVIQNQMTAPVPLSIRQNHALRAAHFRPRESHRKDGPPNKLMPCSPSTRQGTTVEIAFHLAKFAVWLGIK